jgi:hypothetical protein
MKWGLRKRVKYGDAMSVDDTAKNVNSCRVVKQKGPAVWQVTRCGYDNEDNGLV